MARGALPVLGEAPGPAAAGVAHPVPGGTSDHGRTARPLEIPVTGMHCAACVGRVQGVLEATPGVTKAVVNLMTNSASVAFDPAMVTPDALVERIRSTGYGAELPREIGRAHV